MKVKRIISIISISLLSSTVMAYQNGSLDLNHLTGDIKKKAEAVYLLSFLDNHGEIRYTCSALGVDKNKLITSAHCLAESSGELSSISAVAITGRDIADPKLILNKDITRFIADNWGSAPPSAGNDIGIIKINDGQFQLKNYITYDSNNFYTDLSSYSHDLFNPNSYFYGISAGPITKDGDPGEINYISFSNSMQAMNYFYISKDELLDPKISEYTYSRGFYEKSNSSPFYQYTDSPDDNIYSGSNRFFISQKDITFSPLEGDSGSPLFFCDNLLKQCKVGGFVEGTIPLTNDSLFTYITTMNGYLFTLMAKAK